MQVHHHIDSITIQVINLQFYQEEFIYFYEMHSLVFISADIQSMDDIYKPDIITFATDTRHPIIYSYHNGSADETTYTTFKFVGLKSYNQKLDKRKYRLLNKFIDFLIKIEIEYRLNRFDIAYDFHINKSIKNFLPIRVNRKGMKSKPKNPFDYYEKTTLYLEDKSVKKPSLKAYIYDKSVKNNLDERIIRFEISIRNIKNEYINYETIVRHMQEQLSKYKLFYFPIIAECNKNKWLYKAKYKFSKKLEKSIVKSGGVAIELSLSDEILEFLAKFFCKDIIEKMIAENI
ncbi:hypothetical protein [Sulfurimonas sp.]